MGSVVNWWSTAAPRVVNWWSTPAPRRCARFALGGRDSRGLCCLYLRNGRFYLQYYKNGQRYQEAAHTSNERKAKAMLKLRLGQIQSDDFIGPSADRISVLELYEDLHSDYVARQRRSIDDLVNHWQAHLQPVFGHLRAAQVTATMITKYAEQRQRAGVASATINRELSDLRRMYHLARRAGKLNRIPTFPAKLPERVRVGFVTDEQYAKLAKECTKIGTWLRALLEVGSTYGWRSSEMTQMRCREVDLISRTIRLEPGTTKNDQGREVTMTPDVKMLLTALVIGKKPDDFVFTRSDGKRILDFRTSWREACIRAGVNGSRLLCPRCNVVVMGGKKYCPNHCKTDKGTPQRLKYIGLLVHDLRRTGARNLRRAGVAEGVIMKIGGRKTRSVFERYAIVSQDDITDALEKLAASRAAKSTAVVVSQSEIDYKNDYSAQSTVQIGQLAAIGKA